MTIRTKARHAQQIIQHWFKVRHLQMKLFSLMGTGQIGKSFDITQYDHIHILVKLTIWLRCAGTAKLAGMVNVNEILY